MLNFGASKPGVGDLSWIHTCCSSIVMRESFPHPPFLDEPPVTGNLPIQTPEIPWSNRYKLLKIFEIQKQIFHGSQNQKLSWPRTTDLAACLFAILPLSLFWILMRKYDSAI